MRSQKCPGPCNFPGLFELRIEPSDHTNSRYVTVPAQLLANPFPVDVKSLDAPIASGNGILKPMSDNSTPLLKQYINLSSTILILN